MKITKRQLTRIIKEEKSKLLRESVADFIDFDDLISSVSQQISDLYVELMGEELFDEDPEMFAGRSTRPQWLGQVNNAAVELESKVSDAIRRAIGENESRLHDGAFKRGPSPKNRPR